MFSRALKVTIQTSFFGAISMLAQTTCGNTKLACLLPTALHTNPPTFNFFNEAFGTQIGQLPLATPASGFIFTFDKQLGVYKSSQESFGPLLAERVETIGRHKVYVAFTYQWFGFSDIDGNDLHHLPLLFSFPSAEFPQVVTQTDNRIDTTVNQYVVFGTFGLSDHVDVSIAVPFERISMGVTSKGTEYSTTTSASASFTRVFARRSHWFRRYRPLKQGDDIHVGAIRLGYRRRIAFADRRRAKFSRIGCRRHQTIFCYCAQRKDRYSLEPGLSMEC